MGLLFGPGTCLRLRSVLRNRLGVRSLLRLGRPVDGQAVLPEGLVVATFPTSAQQARDQAVRVRGHSKRLREQLARVAEQVAEVEEQCAATHDAMAAHAGPLINASERAARARRFAAVERATAWAYRRGVAPPEVARAALRRPGQASAAGRPVPPVGGGRDNAS